MINCEYIMNTANFLKSLPKGRITIFPSKDPKYWLCEHTVEELLTTFYFDMDTQKWAFLSAINLK